MNDDDLASKVYNEIERVYMKLPQNGKPDKPNIFSVLAGFVAVITDPIEENESGSTVDRVIALSVSTGTKCVSEDMIDDDSGMILHDSHAEVLARRGLIRYLGDNIQRIQAEPSFVNDSDCPLQFRAFTSSSSTKSPLFVLKPNWRIYLCISDSPCGDATIYPTQEGTMTFTGAKLVTSSAGVQYSTTATETASAVDNSGLCVREQGRQEVGQMRLKTGRSDIKQRSQSKSCSDKLCRWRLLGLQSQVLYPLIGKIPFHGVVVAADCNAADCRVQEEALLRAVDTRIQDLLTSQPATSVFHIKVLACSLLLGHFTQSKSYINQQKSRYVSGTELTDKETEVEVSTEQDTKRRRITDATVVPTCIPCSFSTNWQRRVPPSDIITNNTSSNNKKKKTLPVVCHGTVEVTIAQTGLLQGSTSKAMRSIGTNADQDNNQSSLSLKMDTFSSRLAKRSLFQLYQSLLSSPATSVSSPYSLAEYQTWKQLVHNEFESFHEEYDRFFQSPLFSQWRRE